MKKLVVLLISILFISGCEIAIKPVTDVTEREIISFEYSLPEDHPFTYLDSLELNNFLEKGTGILVISNSDNEFSQYYIKLFNKILNDFDINEVYYYEYSGLKEMSAELKQELEINEEYLVSNPEFYLINKGNLLNKYNLDSLGIDEIDVFSDENFKDDIYEFYAKLICEVYKDKCKEEKN